MKERTKATSSAVVDNDVKVYDLTPDMALTDQKKHNIINLINTIDDNQSKPADTAPSQPNVQDVAAPKTEENIPVLEEAPPAAKEEKTPAPEPEKSASTIEKEVDAAFNAAASSTEAMQSAADEQLLDDMSNLTEMVDSAIQKTTEPKQSDEDQPDTIETAEPLESAQEDVDKNLPPNIDEERLAADAAALDLALSADQEMDEAIELTDIVSPPDLEAVTGSETDDDIIELTEIVSPDELDAFTAPQMDGEEIIELADIVDPKELEATALIDTDEEIIELTDIVDPKELEALTYIDADEEIIELTDIVDPAELEHHSQDQMEDKVIELTDILDPDTAKPTGDEAGEASANNEEDEQLIRLSDVLSRKTKATDKKDGDAPE